MQYEEFLTRKRVTAPECGLREVPALSPALYDFQRDIVAWALRRGRAAIFADCGLGKTLMQLEWSRHIPGDVLILAPLAVSSQTATEGERFGIPVTRCRSQADVRPGINITNYEMLDHFDAGAFAGIVLDESSILKSYGGAMRKEITDFASLIPMRLACTATPAPNDIIEICNHAEFLDVMTGKEIIALYFVQDGNTTHAWRLKGHAKADFWRWLSSWAVAIRKPSDLGYDDGAFRLPPMAMHEVIVDVQQPSQGFLFAMQAATLQERISARRDSIDERVMRAAEIVNATDEQFLVWCHLNSESEALRRAIPGAVQITGSDSVEHKERAPIDFVEGRTRVLISKPSITGFGMNFQHCRNMIFVGLSDSWEQYYQAMRRCWRYGQKREVNVYVVSAETEGAVVANIKRKEQQAAEMMEELVKNINLENTQVQERIEMEYARDEASGEKWRIMLGDSCERIKEVESNSAGLCVFSPPFPGMYAYTNSPRDIGNSTTIGQMMTHFEYLMPELLRITMPGRMCCIHLCQLTAMLNRDGYIGLKDYRGAVIEQMQDNGWVYAGEVTIDKNPQIQATRNKERGLLFKTLATDSSLMRMALADYLIYFRKPSQNLEPVRAGISQKYNPGGGWITEEEWIEWAAPVWYRQTKHYPGGIRETDVLNVRPACESDDERHLCPLQLGVIERAIKLWSAPGDLVFSPFNGVGSEGYMALKLQRRYLGIELKRSYFDQAVRNLRGAESQQNILELTA